MTLLPPIEKEQTCVDNLTDRPRSASWPATLLLNIRSLTTHYDS